MAKILFTMLPANDLGLPTRLVPIARVLADRGHDVAVFNPAPAPARLIEEAGLANLPLPSRALPDPPFDLAKASQAWDVEEFFGWLFADEEFVRANTALHLDLIREFKPDVVVDSFGVFACLAARIAGVPLATVLQGNFHPESAGFRWWAGERPAHLPSIAPLINKVAGDYALGPVTRSVDLLAGDLSLIVGTPETDPVSPTARVTHIGPIVWQRGDAELPTEIASLRSGKPVVWVYSGNPRYAPVPTAIDSIVVMRAAIAALGEAAMEVVLTTGYQEVPAEIGTLPSNFHHAAYVPGRAMAERSDLMVHHGGHSSVMQSLAAGTPAVIIPTISERESNARRLVALGAGEMVLPIDGANGEKEIDVADFAEKVQRVLHEERYRAAAHSVAERMRQFGGAQDAADRIELLVLGKV
ncbi:MAG TPA: nucleotide disphospho-sugar-binding domain-containing protein [Chthoniobacterales bacterium]|jgi:UDP:flavonoid glycosyltransferase YjiC (YdhE family)